MNTAEQIDQDLRRANSFDIGWFVHAGREFCKHTPMSFSAEGYAATIREALRDPSCIVVVKGSPAHAHCAARLYPSLYNPSEVLAKVFSTWGDGGLQCFREVERLAEESGASFVFADSMIEPRIESFYRRRGYSPCDRVFMRVV